ncbi:RNA polymerase sigma factor (sigma-70 family) [Alkalibacillus filiformis]|uniref:RNA polymerase sigma factor (Sigma-70 family) n=1 Tax=Alkalibacillus filiformis TaxID=200990 RepID=A0ABU0DUB9_9BACI|nr:sigma-70 family RNA polymerase sigma factor [Alkalibacillus filiformis]MDQ0352057.1 RNA polymerase sigma factor (sigma-70 family) [Alkalibacillus filiformis]
MDNRLTDQQFEDLLKQYNNMIHYQIHKLFIKDYEGEFYQEGVTALWEAYLKYGQDPTFPKMATIHIRSRLIDKIRKHKRVQDRETFDKYIDHQNHQVVINKQIEHFDPHFWSTVRQSLSDKQWLFIEKRILKGYSIKDIADQEQTTVDAVKGWGQAAKRKLRSVLKDYNIT